MNSTSSIKVINDDVSYVYQIFGTFYNNSAATSSHPINYATAQKVKMVISSEYTDGNKPAPNVNIFLQINPPPATLAAFNIDGKPIYPDTEGKYSIATDVTGSYTAYFAASDNCYHRIEVYSQEDNKSEPTEYTIFFGDYTHATTDIPSPSVPLNENNILDIPTNDPYFYVSLIIRDDLNDGAGFSCVAITNGTNFTIMDYEEALQSPGMPIPSAYLRTDKDNEISYFIENNTGADVTSSPNLTFPAQGTPYNHPSNDPNQNRNLTSRPTFNEGQTSITPNNSSYLHLTLVNQDEAGGVKTYRGGDVVVFTMYINGYYAGSNTKKVTVFDLPPMIVPAGASSLTTQIASNFTEGFGQNQSNTPGRYDLDYVVKPQASTDETTWKRPSSWLKGNIYTTYTN